MVLFNPVFNWSNNLLWSWVEEVTTGTYNLVSIILNVSFVGLLIQATGLPLPTASLYILFAIMQFTGKVKAKNTSQLINGISSAKIAKMV